MMNDQLYIDILWW